MSVNSIKCVYSAKFLPLVKQMQTQGPEIFRSFLEENFEDAEQLYNRFLGNINYDSSPLPVENVEQVDTRLGLKLNSEVNNSSEFYIGDTVRHQQMLRAFNSRIIASSVFNRETNEFINANKVFGDFTLLNQLLFNYKIDLLNTMSNYLADADLILDYDLINSNSETLTKIANNILSAFESTINKADLDKTTDFYNAYDAYVTFTKFDSLLKEQAPYIQVLSEVQKSNNFHVNKYTYRGPNVEHYTGFSTNEHMSAEEHSSDLAKILLDYFPEINTLGNEIKNTSITLSGFNSVMTKMVSAIQNTAQMNEYLDELSKGLDADITLLIDAYLNNLENSLITNKDHKTYLQNKLRAIRRFIYNPEMNQNVKNMFTQMMFKTVPASYVAYEYDSVKKQIAGKDLKERPISYQRYALDNSIKASVWNFKSNPKQFQDKLAKYNIKIGNNTITFDQVYEGIPTTFTISYNRNSKGHFDYTVLGNLSPQVLNDLVYDFMSQLVPDDFLDVSKQIYSLEASKQGAQNLYLPIVATIILASSGNSNFDYINDLIDTSPYNSQIFSLANVLSVINGSDIVNVIKNAEGNNLPLYQIISLAHNHHSVIQRTEQQSLQSNRESVGLNNLLFKNSDRQFLLSPKIRSDVSINGKVKKPSTLTVPEVLRLAIVNDFYQGIQDGIINIQPTTFSDKNKHFLPSFNIKTTLSNGLNIKEQLDSYLNGNKSALDPIFNTLFETRRDETNALVSNILNDYSEAYGKEFSTIEQVNDFIKSKTLSEIQTAFVDAGLNFYLDIHAYKSKQGTRFNETIAEYYNTYNSRQATELRLENEKRKFLKDLLDNKFNLNISDSSINKEFSKFKGWVDSSGNVVLAKVTDGKNNIELSSIANLNTIVANKNWKVELHPVLEAFFITDALLANSYNNLMVGGVYAHANKNSRENISDPNYAEHSEASRLISQYKRMVIYGATYHPLAQNLKNGVTPEIKIAVINDNVGTVWNMLGEQESNLDSMDGSGLVSPYQSRFENNSLLDARVGKDKKSIFHDIDSIYGRPTLLKWAAFEITNERRRLSFMSDISQEKLFTKMHSIELNQDIDLETYYSDYEDEFGTIYFKDWRTGTYHYISEVVTDFENGELIAYRSIGEVNKNGRILSDDIKVDRFVINSIYDLDQLFGGSFAMSYNNDYKSLQYSEANLDIVENIMVEENLKDRMIAYLVNKSAIKVGAGNINQEGSFFDNTPLMTINMSTAFGGVQMDADHSLDLSEVTEMTQMISALEQNGYTHNITTQIYSDIGKVVAQSMKSFDESIKSQDKEQVYNILAKALINSFLNDDKDTLGLAQSFVTLASQSLQKSNLDYTIPFSASTINGAFIATTTSNLVKSGIRRKYSGVGAVLAPSNNMMQYYNIGDFNYTFDELLPIIKNRGITDTIDFEGNIVQSAIEKALNDVMINEQLNPFIVEITQNDIDFEDTILIYNLETGEYSDPIKIDSFDKYDQYKRTFNPNLKYFNWTIKPKNLKQSNTSFDVIIGVENGEQVLRTFNIYDLDSVRASFYLNAINPKTYGDLIIDGNTMMLDVLNSATGLTITDLNTPININSLQSLLKEKTQQQLDGLANGTFIQSSTVFGVPSKTVKPLNVTVAPAQIIMGRSNASKLGLQPGDSISTIMTEGANFFYNRLQGKYNIDNGNKSTFDAVLFTGTGEQIYVKFGDRDTISQQFKNYNITENTDFRIVDNLVYYNGQEVSNTDEKQFYKYTDTDGNTYDLIVINNINRLNELKKSNLFDTYKLNYTDDNAPYLMEFQFARNIEENRPIKLKTYDALGNFQEVTFNVRDNNVTINAETLASNEELNFNDRLRKISQNKYEAFLLQLNYVGARIPTQSMQSFMPMVIVAFTDSEVNDVYVPKVQTWLQGSDYDIDKLYILGYSINNNGSFQTTSILGNNFNVREVMKLPLPDGRRFKFGENGYVVTNENMSEYLRGNLSIFTNILNSGLEEVTFEEGIERQDSTEFLRDLNMHSSTVLSSSQLEEGLKNNIVSGIFDVVLNPKNQINLHVPINMTDQQNAARNTTLGEGEKIMTSDNPGSKYVMQIQNMVGKEVIGMTAVAIKTFFLLSNYYNTEYSKVIPLLEQENMNDAAALVTELTFTNPLNGAIGVLANINFTEVLNYLEDNNISVIRINVTDQASEDIARSLSKWGDSIWDGDLFNIKSAIELLRDSANVPDASLVLSGLLSAATDNAKELILAKINATSNFVNIYNYLISIGTPFNDIANIMTSNIFNHIVKLTDGNVFNPDTYGFSLEKAISFYLGEKILPVINPFVFEKIFSDFIDTKEKYDLQTLLKDNDIVNKFREYLKPLLVRKSNISYDETGYFGDEGIYEAFDSDEAVYEYNDYDAYEAFDDYGQNQTFNPNKRNFLSNPLNEIDYQKAFILTDYLLERNNSLSNISNVDTQLAQLRKIYESILPATKEMQTLGRMAGINQGIRTNSYDKYSYIKNIENFINNRVEEFNKQSDMRLQKFNLFEFLNNPELRNQFIQEYENIKSAHNILRAITTVPHFNEMFKILYYDNEIISQLSLKNRLELQLANDILDGKPLKLNDTEFRELSRYINDVLIYNWIKGLNRTLSVPIGQNYIKDRLGNTTTNSLEGFSLQLNTLEGIASFKMLMDDYIIPTLKESDDYKDNKFIKALTVGIVESRSGIDKYWKLPINMMQVDNSVRNQTTYEGYLSDFNVLNGKTFEDWNIVDLFYLYNLLVNKDSFGQRAFTRLFEDIVKVNSQDLLVTQYYNYLSRIDFDQNVSIEYNLDDLRYRLSLVSSNPFQKFNSYIDSKGGVVLINSELTQNPKNVNTEYFTLNMPFLTLTNSKNVLELTEVKSKDNRYYKTTLDTKEMIFSIVSNFNSKYNGEITIITDSDFEGTNDPSLVNSKAFIENGNVFINLDKADISSPLHELTHIVMAGLKMKYPEVYYNLLSSISTHPLYQIISEDPLYSNKHGSDLDEEVFATVMSEYFKNKVYEWNDNNTLSEIDNLTKQIIDEIFDVNTEDLDIQSLMNVPLETMLYNFGSLLVTWKFDDVIDIEYTKLNQKLATVKDNLIAEEIINKECYG